MRSQVLRISYTLHTAFHVYRQLLAQHYNPEWNIMDWNIDVTGRKERIWLNAHQRTRNFTADKKDGSIGCERLKRTYPD